MCRVMAISKIGLTAVTIGMMRYRPSLRASYDAPLVSCWLLVLVLETAVAAAAAASGLYEPRHCFCVGYSLIGPRRFAAVAKKQFIWFFGATPCSSVCTYRIHSSLSSPHPNWVRPPLHITFSAWEHDISEFTPGGGAFPQI